MKIGIDFGTSYSMPAVRYLDQNLVLLPGGKYGIPSLFYYNQWDGVLVGEAAQEAGVGDEAKNLKREIKLELNSTFTASGKTFTAKQIVGYILASVKANAIETANTKLIEEEIEGAVISVPVAFEHNEKAFIREAAQIPAADGGPELEVLGFIKEPVAAALAYFDTSLEDHTRVLVYDLGGGTCDVAIVEADSSVSEKYTVIDSDMLRVGGKNWDERLESYILDEIERQSGIEIRGNAGYMEKIKRASVLAKHAFSEKTGETYRDKVRARVEINGRTYQIPITRDMFDNLTMDLFVQTLDMTKALLEKNDGEGIDRIVCVGGSSNMPQVREGLKEAFASKEVRIYEPEKAIAVGAAIYAQYCDGGNDFLSDIAAFSYGTDCCKNYDKNPDDMIVVNLIKKGDRLPMTKEHTFCTTRDNIKSLYFGIVENSNPDEEYDCGEEPVSHMMNIELKLPENTPKGTYVKLYITLTTDGIIEVRADDMKGHTITTSKQLNF